MSEFFEEELSKRLIKHHQVLLCLLIGYLETNDLEIYKRQKVWNHVKDAMASLHRNYLVFVEFICTNLTDDQYEAAKDWAIILEEVLQSREITDASNNLFNSEVLQSNNNIAIKHLSELLKHKPDENEFK